MNKLKEIAGPNVTFTGYALDEELLHYYQTSKVYCQLSAHEGFGVSLAEAMACGVPIIATKVAGIPHLIEDEENGLLINPASKTEICQAIKRLVDNPELRDQLVTNGLATVRNHTLEAERDRMIIKIQRLLNSGENARADAE